MPSESKPDEMSSAESSSSCDHKTSNENINMMHDDTGIRSEQQLRKISYDPTEYVQKARVTRAAPPPPANNPLQFVTIKPVKLYQTAQEQVKRTEELMKKTKEVRKEDAEEWQSNLDNWKSSRRKRVEHIIDRVVEVKKLELVDHDRNRKKSKTFSEMMEERGSKRKISVPIFTGEEENNDFSDLGIGTSSTSGKSSLSEDFDNHSVMSDNQEAKSEKSLDLDLVGNGNGENRGYISSPGYDTSSSNAPASSPDPSEYTYEAAIQNYKTRVSLATQSTRQAGQFSKDSTPERTDHVSRKRNLSSKIEDRLLTMEMKANGNEIDERETVKKDLPKVDISKRRELFEKHTDTPIVKTIVKEELKVKSIKERLSNLELTREREERKIEELPFEIPSIRERFVILEKKVTHEKPKVEVHLSASLQDRLNSLHSAVIKPTIEIEENYKPFNAKEKQIDNDTDREDSGIHTTDVSSSVSQADEQNEILFEDINTNVLDQIVEQMSNDELKIETDFDNAVSDAKISKEVTPEESNIVIPDLIQNNVGKNMLETPEIEIEGPLDDQDASVIEALEIAFQEIDNENIKNSSKQSPKLIRDFDELQVDIDPIYENLDDILIEKTIENITSEKLDEQNMIIHDSVEEPKASPAKVLVPKKSILKTRSTDKKNDFTPMVVEESHYQVPTSEPYYEVPKTKPVPLYENIEMFGTAAPMTMENKYLEPPKEKPPPPPIEDDDSENEEEIEQKAIPQANDVFKRVNSTKRIKKEIRNKRSSFLGIEGGDDDSFLEISVQPPPDMAAFLEEERRLERQLLLKAGFSDSSDAGDSRDSGVSENHSRQSSGPYSSEEHENGMETMQEHDEELHEVLQKGEKRRSKEGINNREEEVKIRNIERQIREQDEVLRVERELFQLEQEELKRQRESMIYHENLARKELNHGAKMLMSANRNKIHEINNDQHYSNLPHPHQHQAYQIETDYRKSMPDLQYIMDQKRLLPVPPAKPLRAQFQQDYMNVNTLSCISNETCESSNYNIIPPRVPYPALHDDYCQIRGTPQQHSQPRSNHSVNQYANMTKHTLHALSATPKPKLTNDWVQHRRTDHSHDLYQDLYRKKDPYLRSTCVSRNSDTWVQNQYKRRSDPQNFNYSNHWLIQEAEQRRMDQQRGPRTKKPLPDSVIQTITQRVQSLGLGERRRPTEPSISVSNGDLSQIYQEQDRVLSVSGKKKCSHCGNELGRGAAMIIESLRLFYHIDCFKCSVCCSSLGDGLGGTDVRVRNSKLHCQSCYSSDDGVKFSCV